MAFIFAYIEYLSSVRMFFLKRIFLIGENLRMNFLVYDRSQRVSPARVLRMVLKIFQISQFIMKYKSQPKHLLVTKLSGDSSFCKQNKVYDIQVLVVLTVLLIFLLRRCFLAFENEDCMLKAFFFDRGHSLSPLFSSFQQKSETISSTFPPTMALTFRYFKRFFLPKVLWGAFDSNS